MKKKEWVSYNFSDAYVLHYTCTLSNTKFVFWAVAEVSLLYVMSVRTFGDVSNDFLTRGFSFEQEGSLDLAARIDRMESQLQQQVRERGALLKQLRDLRQDLQLKMQQQTNSSSSQQQQQLRINNNNNRQQDNVDDADVKSRTAAVMRGVILGTCTCISDLKFNHISIT